MQSHPWHQKKHASESTQTHIKSENKNIQKLLFQEMTRAAEYATLGISKDHFSFTLVPSSISYHNLTRMGLKSTQYSNHQTHVNTGNKTCLISVSIGGVCWKRTSWEKWKNRDKWKRWWAWRWDAARFSTFFSFPPWRSAYWCVAVCVDG